ncbi:hypothetical protein [Rathayibacter sp. AY1H2]|uniref:hypothetical protein n=1 Tax=Rathayibacter sp. AY1H2 TaxID=2080566 RepID=UPI0011B0566E|nr:hypothetical protein [Rathayibacter sp. AY1H2]
MQNEDTSTPTGAPDRLTQRRTVVKGAAWAIPVVAASIAAPMASASTAPQCALQDAQRIDATSTTALAARTIPVPAGTQWVRFTAVGGDGGGVRTGSDVTSAGARVTGTIPVDALGGASEIVITAGSGGSNQAGGRGLGNGGAPGTPGYIGSGGGGGASGITAAGSLLVIAGGGGGSAAGFTSNDFTRSARVGPNAGSGGPVGGSGYESAVSRADSSTGSTEQAPSTGGSQTGPGQPGVTTVNVTESVLGSPGSGRDGGAGAPRTNASRQVTYASGGGGGGYFGGAGGGTSLWVRGGGSYAANASTGAGGSSFAASGVTVENSDVDTRSQTMGYVEVAFFVCE